jgi:hypothetical protein
MVMWENWFLGMTSIKDFCGSLESMVQSIAHKFTFRNLWVYVLQIMS